MIAIVWTLCFLILAVILIVGASFICFRLAFGVPRHSENDALTLPRGKQYEKYRDESLTLIRAALALPYEDVWTMSHDGLRLYAKYYHTADNAPVQIMVHGYQSVPERDFCGGMQMAFDMGHNVLLIDQRAHGKSGGKCLTFGIKEQYDCLSWIQYILARFGSDTKILLSGISMGASTVLMAAGLQLPENVFGIVADCGYTSPKEIIKKVLKQRKYPVSIVYPAVRLGGILFGNFDIESGSCVTALKNCKTPVLLIHGEDDRFVPCEMSRENYKACSSEKYLLTVPEAGHGISYMVDKKLYVDTVSKFIRHLLRKTTSSNFIKG